MSQYSVFLPKTSFKMKASLNINEPEILKLWNDTALYQKLRRQAIGRKKFILHWGPPYANGHLHIGHALTYILKDIVNKIYQMNGYDAPLVPGWDCHGLPIEWKIEEKYRAQNLNKDDVDPLLFLKECRTFANHWIDVQKNETKRLGIIADFENPYITMDFTFEAKVVEILYSFLEKGYIVKGLKPVMWSVIEQTALAEAEIEYNEEHISDSIYVSFPIKKIPDSLKHLTKLKGAEVAIWTTTPWTLPANRAICYHNEIIYSLIKVLAQKKEHIILIAQNLIEPFLNFLNNPSYEELFTLIGESLVGLICSHPLANDGYTLDVPLLHGDHVEAKVGTGFVHTAPSHGIEDFALGKKHNLEISTIVQSDGFYSKDTPLFGGEHVYKVAPKIIEQLKKNDALLYHTKITHSYPYSWRSKTPLIYRATAQWFIDLKDIKEIALKEIEKVAWIPHSGKNRIKSMVESRAEWCLSRQRKWGIPLALFVDKETGLPLKDSRVFKRVISKIMSEGVEAWHKYDVDYFLKELYDSSQFEKVMDVVDVWFDSGSTHEIVLKERCELEWPADLYLEGSDQHRGWFQSSLLNSCALNGAAPYRKVLTHGFVLDEKGRKMSKSLGNVISPQEIIEKYGADIIRLWVVTSNYNEDIRIGSEILKHIEDLYRRFRNTIRYLLGAISGLVLSDFCMSTSEGITLDESSLTDLDRWILHQVCELHDHYMKAVKNFDFKTFYSKLHHFCGVDLSAFYLDIQKDRLYCDLDEKRIPVQSVMYVVLMHLLCWLAPVLSFTTEEAYQVLLKENAGLIKDPLSSIHEWSVLKPNPSWLNMPLSLEWERVKSIRLRITKLIEEKRAAKEIGSSLQVSLALTTHDVLLRTFLEKFNWSEIAIVSDFKIVQSAPPHDLTKNGEESLLIDISQAVGQKCQRCWKVLKEVEDDLCLRCLDVISKL